MRTNQFNGSVNPVKPNPVRGHGHHFSVPLDPGGDFVDRLEVVISLTRALRRLDARFDPEGWWKLVGSGCEPADDDLDDLNLLDADSLDYDSTFIRDWWQDSADDAEAEEFVAIQSVLRRNGTTRVDAEEEARLYGYIR